MAAAALKNQPEFEDLSISEIARRCGLDKATVRTRLDLLEEEPVLVEAKLKLYRNTGDDLIHAVKSAKDSLSAARIQGLRLDNNLKKIKLAEASRELVPFHEVVEIAQAIVKTIYEEYTVRQPKRIGPQLAKAKNVAAVKLLLKKDSDRVMKQLRENFEKFIEQK